MAYRDAGSQALRRPNRQQHPVIDAVHRAAVAQAQAQQARAALRSSLAALVASHLSNTLQPGGPMQQEQPNALQALLGAAQSQQQPAAAGILGAQRMQGPLGQVGGVPARRRQVSGVRQFSQRRFPALRPPTY